MAGSSRQVIDRIAPAPLVSNGSLSWRVYSPIHNTAKDAPKCGKLLILNSPSRASIVQHSQNPIRSAPGRAMRQVSGPNRPAGAGGAAAGGRAAAVRSKSPWTAPRYRSANPHNATAASAGVQTSTAVAGGGIIDLENCQVSFNSVGVQPNAGNTIRLSNTRMTGNGNALNFNGGTIVSYQNNRIAGNAGGENFASLTDIIQN